jgi:hypothetical protein
VTRQAEWVADAAHLIAAFYRPGDVDDAWTVVDGEAVWVASSRGDKARRFWVIVAADSVAVHGWRGCRLCESESCTRAEWLGRPASVDCLAAVLVPVLRGALHHDEG